MIMIIMQIYDLLIITCLGAGRRAARPVAVSRGEAACCECRLQLLRAAWRVEAGPDFVPTPSKPA